MKTIFGFEVDLLNPKPETIDIRDIALALGRQCRYNGMTREHCSVAEHSIMVANLIFDANGTKHDQFCGLMHDAHEAYIGDMIQPMKTMPGLGEAYKKLEDVWIKVIAAKYEMAIDKLTLERVYNSDMDAAATEMRDLTTFEEDVWQSVGRARELKIQGTMDARTARFAFLQLFVELGGEKTWTGERNGI